MRFVAVAVPPQVRRDDGEIAGELARLAQTLTESLDVTDVVSRTVESVLPLFGGIRNVKSDSAWGKTPGLPFYWAEDVSGALQQA